MSLRTRIAAVAGLAVAVTVVAAAVVVYVAVRSNLRGEVDRALTARAQPFVARAGPDHDGDHNPFRPGFGPGPPPGAERFGGAEGYVQRIAPTGTLTRVSDQTIALPARPAALAIAARGSGRAFTDVNVSGAHLRVLTVGLGPSLGAVQIARPLNETDNVLSRVLLVLVVVGAVGIALAALLGAFVARTALGPIARFTRRTEALAARPDLSERMEVAGRDELARLASSFNTTLDALERAVDSQRQLIADASHELRTPISSLRANIQTLEDAERLPREDLANLRADIIEELDELTGLVGDVVELARGARPDDDLDDVRLDELVTTMVARARRRGDDNLGYEVRVEPTLIRGESDRIARAVTNLLDNARRWSPHDGVIDVELAGGTLTVRDHGPGFSEEDLPRVFERFYRAKQARGMPGSGLGLAIVRQAAEAHGGAVEASNAPDGGAILRVRFGEPLAMGDASPALSEAHP